MDVTIGDTGAGWAKRIRVQEIPEIVDRCFASIRPPITPGKVFSRLAAAIAVAEGKPHWIEKTPNHLNCVNRILAELPKSRFVVMVRDPYTFMLSYKHQMDRGNPDRRRAFARRYHPLGCALVWRTSLRHALQAAHCYPNSVLLVYQEEIRDDPSDVLRRVQEFFLLEPVARLEGVSNNVNSSFLGSTRPILPDSEVFWMNLIAKREILRGSFALQSPHRDLAALARSLIQLPVWAMRVFFDIRRRGAGGHWQYLWRWMLPRKAAAEKSAI